MDMLGWFSGLYIVVDAKESVFSESYRCVLSIYIVPPGLECVLVKAQSALTNRQGTC
jgi:hypothetical protein